MFSRMGKRSHTQMLSLVKHNLFKKDTYTEIMLFLMDKTWYSFNQQSELASNLNVGNKLQVEKKA